MFERFSDRAKQVVVLSQEEARAFKHDFIGTEHVLLGLMREGGLAARALGILGVTVEDVRAHVARIVGQGDGVTAGQIPFTPRAKKVLELALREAVALEHDYVGTEHLLLAIARENQGVAARILLELGADGDRIRSEVARTLSGPSRDVATAGPVRRSRTAAVLTEPGFAQPVSVLVALALGLAFAVGLLFGWLLWGL